MKRVAIIGLGLMGGSLGLALKSKGSSVSVRGYARRAQTRTLALNMNVVDEVFESPAQAVKDADLVVFCVPILSIPELVKNCQGAFKKNSIVTDVGSTKKQLAVRMDALLKGTSAVYVGSHPIAGSERMGLDAARPDLYEKAVVVVTPVSEHVRFAVDELTGFWQGLGSVVRLMSPEEHDRIMARTSHLPHLISALLVATVGREGDLTETGYYCGPGFRDTTRLAEGSAEVWHDIINSNRQHVLEELRVFEQKLGELVGLIEQDDFEQMKRLLEDCGAKRKILAAKRDSGVGRGEL